MYNYCVRKFYGCHPGDEILVLDSALQNQDAAIGYVQGLNSNSIKVKQGNFKRKKLYGPLDPQTLCVARFEIYNPQSTSEIPQA